MRLTIICHDVPFPPIHGGRVDMWNRLTMLQEQGVSTQCLAWTYTQISVDHQEQIARSCADFIPSIIDNSWQVRFHPRRPYIVTSRQWRKSELSRVIQRVNDFKPDLLICEGVSVSGATLQLSNALKIPFVLRAHNLEKRYLRELMRTEDNHLRKARLLLDAMRMDSWEAEIFHQACQVFHISLADLNHCIEQGYSNHSWLPQFLNFQPQATNVPVIYDVGYLGNLRTSNNVQGVKWFLKEVFPGLDNVRVAIAGSTPEYSIKRLCEQLGVDLVADLPSAWEFFASCRVLINPIFYGSGVNIKTLEMLASGRPVITTPVGVQGYPAEVQKLAQIAATPTHFQQAICDALAGVLTVADSKDILSTLNAHYGYPKVVAFLEQLQALVSKEKS